jgi:hypothetical protein
MIMIIDISDQPKTNHYQTTNSMNASAFTITRYR